MSILGTLNVQRDPIRRGDRLPWLLTMTTDENGVAWSSFAGYRVDFSMKRSAAETDAEADIHMHSEVGGGINAGITAYWEANTLDLKPGEMYYYDVQIYREDLERPITLETGFILVLPDITHYPLTT
jgi:hypothetical protein